MKNSESELLKLDAHLVHPQSVGDRRIYLHGFPGDPLAFLHVQVGKRPHVV